MYHYEWWMHLKKGELESIKVESHKSFHSPDPESKLDRRQGEEAIRVSSEQMKGKIKVPHSTCSPKADSTLRVPRELICLHTLPILACPYFHGKKKKCVQQNHSTCTLFVLIK